MAEPSGSSGARWELSRGPARLLPNEREERARRLSEALRTGSGLPAEFVLRWESGPAARVSVTVDDPASRRWWERCVVPSYPPGRWEPVPAAPTRAEPIVRFLAAQHAIDIPFAGAEPAPWSDAVLAALPLLPVGLRLEWSVRATGLIGTPVAPAPALEGRLQPPGYRLRPLTAPERDLRDRQERRRHGPCWEVRARLERPRTEVGRSAAIRLERIVRTAAARDGGNTLRFLDPRPIFRARPPPLYVSEPELAGLLPGASTRWSPTARGRGPVTELPFGRSEEGTLLGIPIEPGEGRHLAILGETGMGKSSVLVELAAASAAVANVILLDPIGDTGRRLLTRLSTEQLARVLWISPTESPVAIDLLASLRISRVGEAAAERSLSELVDALRRVRALRYSETPFWGPRIEETVRRALGAAAAIPGARVEDAVRLLEGVGRRPGGVPAEAKEAIDALWLRARERPEEVDGSRRLLAELTERPILRRLLSGNAPRCAVADLLEARRITIITAEAGIVGEATARYLLAVYLSLLWTTRLGQAQPTKTVLLLDEAQWYAHDSVAEMLRLGRRANLHVFLATQGLASLPENVRDAVQTNVSDLLMFRGSPDDARDVGRWAPQLSPEALLAQPRGSGIALLGKGREVLPFRTRPSPAFSRERAHVAEEAAARVSQRFWPAEESPDAPRAPAEAARVVPAPPGPVPASDSVRRVLLVLWAALLDAAEAPEVRVHLARLRTAADPSGVAVREAGRRLQESGVLMRTDRDADGSWWEVRRAGFDTLLGPGVGPAELRDATERWTLSAAERP